mgnify:FL=1
MGKKKTTDQFIEKAIAIHGDKYEYSCVEYDGAYKKVKIWCNTCSEYFYQQANAHLQGTGCKECAYKNNSNRTRKTKEKFIEEARIIHGNKFNYELVNYVNTHTYIKIQCLVCQTWNEQTPLNHLQGAGCLNCAKIQNGVNKRKTKDQFIEEAIAIHGDKYEYSDIEYKDNKTKVKIWCFKCEKMFWHIPSDHLNGHGCKRCCLFGQSKKAIRWLEIMQNEFKDVEHAKNKGEFRIPGTNFMADGWSPRTKTIFEFQGCYWHGCLCFEDRNEINERTGKTMQQLYEYTTERERIIRELGYNIISIWECEFDEKYN